MKDMNRTEIITTVNGVAINSISFVFNTVKKTTAIAEMTVKLTASTIYKWCDEVEGILITSKL